MHLLVVVQGVHGGWKMGVQETTMNLIKKIREFDYSDLRFLYVACLVGIGLVYTIFRVCQHAAHVYEGRAIGSLQRIERQRDLVQHLHSLLRKADRPWQDKLAADTYAQILKQQESLHREATEKLKKTCRNLTCNVLFQGTPFKLQPKELENISSEQEWANTHAAMRADIGIYDEALRQAAKIHLQNIEEMTWTNLMYDLVAYLAVMGLLLLQAVYVFQPAIRRLNASLATRSEFLSRVSHEIRNPMNSILGMSDVMRRTRLNYEQRQYLDNLIRSGHSLLDMLNNLIDFSSLENKKVQLKDEEFDLYETIDRCIDLISIQAHDKGLNVYVAVDPRIQNIVFGDSSRLEQVLINLLNNAVKFTEQGHILLTVDIQSFQDRAMDLLFSVQDSGIGIRQDQLGEIFESFVQADSSIRRRYGGSGLGLSISSELIRLMGGHLQVTSALQKGSRFYFSVRFNKQTEAPPIKLKELEDKHVAYVVTPEELSRTRALLGANLPNAKFISGIEDLNSLLKDPETPSFHEIIIDDQVGIVTMIACRKLAERYQQGCRCIGLIRSTFAKENMDLLEANGFKRVLIKPFRPWQLLKLTEGEAQLQNDSDDEQQTLSLPDRMNARKLRVLLVDDSDDNLFLLDRIIQPFSTSVHYASNGLEALEKFTIHTFDVVFMDIQMPVMDGYTTMRRIRELENDRDVKTPVFAVTAHGGLVDAQNCFEAGFSDRIVKPLRRAQVYNSLAMAFGQEELKDPALTEDLSFSDLRSAIQRN